MGFQKENKHRFQKGHKINVGKKNHLGFKHSEESKRKIGEKSRGHIPWNKGKLWPEEIKKRISQTNKRKGIEPAEKFIGLGEKHWNWKGGITPENNRIRGWIEYRLWREAIFARDNWTCQKTGIRGEKLHPHHIKNFAQFPELRFAIDNGITLSEKAHRKFHKEYGKENNTREQLEEFLKEDLDKLK